MRGYVDKTKKRARKCAGKRQTAEGAGGGEEKRNKVRDGRKQRKKTKMVRSEEESMERGRHRGEAGGPSTGHSCVI